MNKSFSLRSQAYIASRLAFLVKADIPLLEALRMMLAQAHSKKENRLLSAAVLGVGSGSLLSTALQKSGIRFHELAVQIIRTGEMTGTLGASLEYVSLELKKRHQLVQKIVGALFYPLCIGVATIGVTAMIVLYILPKISPIFSDLHATLPFSTRLLLSIHEMVSAYGVYIAFGLIFTGAVHVLCWKKILPYNMYIERTVLFLPLFGTMMKQYEMTQTFRTLGLLLKSGMTLSDSMHNVASASSINVYKKEYADLARHVVGGLRASDFLAARPRLFPVVTSQMMAVGESSSTLAEVALHISDYYEKELDEVVKKLSSSLEPVLLVVMGAIVGFVAISIITPIYEITQNIKK